MILNVKDQNPEWDCLEPHLWVIGLEGLKNEAVLESTDLPSVIAAPGSPQTLTYSQISMPASSS